MKMASFIVGWRAGVPHIKMASFIVGWRAGVPHMKMASFIVGWREGVPHIKMASFIVGWRAGVPHMKMASFTVGWRAGVPHIKIASFIVGWRAGVPHVKMASFIVGWRAGVPHVKMASFRSPVVTQPTGEPFQTKRKLDTQIGLLSSFSRRQNQSWTRKQDCCPGFVTIKTKAGRPGRTVVQLLSPSDGAVQLQVHSAHDRAVTWDRQAADFPKPGSLAKCR